MHQIKYTEKCFGPIPTGKITACLVVHREQQRWPTATTIIIMQNRQQQICSSPGRQVFRTRFSSILHVRAHFSFWTIFKIQQ